PGGLHADAVHLPGGRQDRPAGRDRAADSHAVQPQRAGLLARHLPRARRHHRRVPGGAQRTGGAAGAVRRRDRIAAAVRSAHRPHPAEGAAVHDLSVQPLRHPAREGGHGGGVDQDRAGRAAEGAGGRRQAGGSPAAGAAHALRPGNAQRGRPLQGHRELHAAPVGRAAGSAAIHADRLPAEGLADVPGREPPDDRPARRHVQRRPPAQDHAGGVRLPPALGAGQPAAEIRGVRDPDAAGNLRVGHARQLREGTRRPGGGATGAADGPDRPSGGGSPGHQPSRRRAPGDSHPRREERAGADHHPDQTHGRAVDGLPGGQRRQGPLHAQRHRHRGAGRDPARPAAGRLRRAGGHQPAA
ncbi:MAG: Excinuclease ABC subunit B, partial [uncultured Ramlibacter sp.]